MNSVSVIAKEAKPTAAIQLAFSWIASSLCSLAITGGMKILPE